MKVDPAHFSNRSSFTVALLGFSQTERIALTSMLALSERRALRYSMTELHDADLIVADSDNEATARTLRTTGLQVDAVLIGDKLRELGHPVIARPLEWHQLLKQLDVLVRARQAAEAQPNPDSPPTLPMAGSLEPEATPTIVRAVIRGTADVRNRARGDIAQASRTRKPAEEEVLLKGHVLLVGASAAVQDFVKSNLGPLLVGTDLTDTPESAIARTGERDYHCLMIDISAGGIGAYAACRALKSRRGGSPRIVLIGHAPGPMDRMRARLAGADAVLAKPLSRSQLLKTIGPVPRRST
ncbi:hypothetical protein BH10PSE17_BH10PSE17_28450 [soil metagenome]